MAAKIQQAWKCKQNKIKISGSSAIWCSRYLCYLKSMRWCHQMGKTIWKAHTICIIGGEVHQEGGGIKASIWQFASIGRMEDVWKVEREWESHSIPNNSAQKAIQDAGMQLAASFHNWPDLPTLFTTCLFFFPAERERRERESSRCIHIWPWWLTVSLLLIMSSDSINRNFYRFLSGKEKTERTSRPDLKSRASTPKSEKLKYPLTYIWQNIDFLKKVVSIHLYMIMFVCPWKSYSVFLGSTTNHGVIATWYDKSSAFQHSRGL